MRHHYPWRAISGQLCFECPWCSRREYATVPGLALGRCKCGGKRGFILEPHLSELGLLEWPDTHGPVTEETVICFECHTVSTALTERVAAERADVAAKEAWLADHIRTKHRACQVAERMREIQREARYLMKAGQLADGDWQAHPLAVEWRALMREWWAMPSKATTDVYGRFSGQQYEATLQPLSYSADHLLTGTGRADGKGAPWPRCPKVDGPWRVVEAPLQGYRYGAQIPLADVYEGDQPRQTGLTLAAATRQAALGNYADALRAGRI